LPQEVTDAVFGLAVAVKWRRVEVADTALPGGREGLLRLRFGYRDEQFSQGSAAEAEFRDLCVLLAS